MEFDEREVQKLDLMVLLEDFVREARRLWLIGLALVVVLGAYRGIQAKRSYSPVYQASATFTVKVADPLYADVSTYNMKTAEQMAKTFPHILNSGLLENKVKESLGIPYMPSVSVSVLPNSSVITLRVTDSDPQRAYDVLNGVIAHYPEIAEFVVGATVLQLLDESGVPTGPINYLDVRSTMMKGAILGAGGWLLLVLLFAMTKNTIHNEEMLSRLLNFDCFGKVPSVKVPGRDACPLIHAGRRKPEFSEAIRATRLRVERAMEQGEKKVLLVSSAIPGEGKTTISVNLAMAMARRGKRVLLIDCDLRSPSVAKALRVKTRHSLVDFLTGKMMLRELLCPTETENLFIIPGGAGGGKGTDLITRERGTSMIQAARNLFDFVILDTPPCSMLADAAEVAALADAGLLVVRQDYASRDQIIDGVQRLSDADLPMIGWVFNYVERSLPTGSDYGYSAVYGYGKKGR